MAEKRCGNKKGQEYKLSVREQKFVSLYLEYGDATRAVKEANFRCTGPASYARKLLAKPKIQKEVQAQLALFKNECIASSQEIMAFYTATMRGEVRDQFGLDAPLSERLKAADALAKRQIDAVAIADKAKDNEFKITLSFGDGSDANETTDTDDAEQNIAPSDVCDEEEDDGNE